MSSNLNTVALANLRASKGKYILTGLGIAISSFFIAAVIVLISSLQGTVSASIGDVLTKADNIVISAGANDQSNNSANIYLDEETIKKIQEDQNSNYILLLDEPGLNLHAAAQADLLRFLEDLSQNYQIVYTTHSPFMITSDKLQRVRTILETDKGSIISESIQEKDPKTLFPLQAALGYDIAQNLFISKKNLLVEGVSDLIYLQYMSAILENAGRMGLPHDITIVPTGGLEKVATFISLLRSNDLQIVCLLDSFTAPKGKAKLDNMIAQKIINQKNIRFYNEFLESRKRADIEDLFTKNDYIKLFNRAFDKKYTEIKIENLNADIEQILIQINQYLGIDHFNHYIPANQLSRNGFSIEDFDDETIRNFEKVFTEINKLFEK